MPPPVGLRPLRNVERCGDGFIATSPEPWLTLESAALRPGRFVAITYRASLWDEPVRPVFRFEAAARTVTDRIAPGPVAGAGIWVGRVPAGTIRTSVSPTNRPGHFAFAVEAIRRRSWIGLVLEGLRRKPRAARGAVLTRLIGWRPESDMNLAWATGSTALTDYPRWHAARHRAIDLDGIDAPRFAWSNAIPVHVVIDARTGEEGLAATLQSLQGQVFTHWTASMIGGKVGLPAGDPRFKAEMPGADAFLTTLRPSDALMPEALACLVEAAHRYPDCDLFYGDEAVETASGEIRPTLKAGWSPRLHARIPYLGRCVFLRGSALTGEAERDRFMTSAAVPARIPPGSKVRALRRVLLRTRDAPDLHPRGAEPIEPRTSGATIIIPTRDQPERLGRAVASVQRCRGTAPLRIVIVDNGSTAPDTLRLLADLREGEDVTVLERPGPFNFSAMSNEGAAAAREDDVLVFLNDDTEVLSADWLDRLAHWARQPDIGAVGARLTYPDARVQHIGVVLGMGGSAGHFGSFSAPGSAGWLGRHRAVHEVSAVTGACLAVAKHKFDAVGGFDATNLPVELSDIDLCLKLGERGWTALVDPAVHLLHEESASRGGATFRRAAVYEVQRTYFLNHWNARLRNDPYFHPGLSLYDWEAALA